MFQRLIKNDLKENKVSMLVIGLFLLLTLTLSFAATRLTVSLTSSIERFVETAKSPHLLQMHSGSVDQERLQNFVQQHPEIASWQLTDFVNVEGSAIRINEKNSLQDSSQDNGFSSQNQNFDFLLDQNNQPAQPQPGQVYIPLYYYNSGKIKIGDQIRVGKLQLTVQGFIRDAQMNAGLVSSKRFLISQTDLQTLKKEAFASNENLIAFRVHKLSQISAVEQAYKNAELESNGPPMITYPTIKMINGFNDALVILVRAASCGHYRHHLSLHALCPIDQDSRRTAADCRYEGDGITPKLYQQGLSNQVLFLPSSSNHRRLGTVLSSEWYF